MTEIDFEDLDGIGESTAKNLKEQGYKTYTDLATSSPENLSDINGIGESRAQQLIQVGKDETGMGKFSTGTEVLERRKNVERISTNSEALDELIGGGLETESITEVYGEFGSGKTQLAHQLAVTAQLNEDGESQYTSIYIDTEKSFIPDRLMSMAENLGVDPEKALENVMVARAHSSSAQMDLIEKAEEIANEKMDGNEVRLLVVDSLTSHFRGEYVGRGSLAERQQKLNKHMHQLITLAENKGVAVLVTNQVMSDPDSYFGDPTKPIGGNITGHNSTFRLYIRKSKNTKRIVKLVDSPSRPEGEAPVKITEGGIEDV